jgi:hypothetical protein
VPFTLTFPVFVVKLAVAANTGSPPEVIVIPPLLALTGALMVSVPLLSAVNVTLPEAEVTCPSIVKGLCAAKEILPCAETPVIFNAPLLSISTSVTFSVSLPTMLGLGAIVDNGVLTATTTASAVSGFVL